MIVDKTGKIFDDRRITERRIGIKAKPVDTDKRKDERRKSK